jgi:hypothetical protein
MIHRLASASLLSATILLSVGCSESDDGTRRDTPDAAWKIPDACQPGNREYLSTSPETCSTVSLQCEAGEQAPFSDECGCGCTNIKQLPPGCEQPDRTFICVGLNCCAGIDWICGEGERSFGNQCGCGCEQ